MARVLNTTPQAVSNWKSRNLIPYHVIIKLETRIDSINTTTNKLIIDKERIDDIKLSDIFIILASQLKVIILALFISIFIFFSYVQFFEEPIYVSNVKVLIPNTKSGSMEGLTGIASIFGVNVQNSPSCIDLS